MRSNKVAIGTIVHYYSFIHEIPKKKFVEQRQADK
jgi:hypothetical protein